MCVHYLADPTEQNAPRTGTGGVNSVVDVRTGERPMSQTTLVCRILLIVDIKCGVL